MNRSILFSLFLALLFFAVAVPQTQACRFTCSVGSGGSIESGPGYTICHAGETGGVNSEWSGCDDGGGDSGGGDGGGGGGGGEVYSPDLTASSISPQSVTVNTAQTYTATITNAGSDYAGASATLFQRSSDANGTNATAIGTVSTDGLAAGASRNVSVSYTYGFTGTFYMRACADTNNAVAESNESNNCGPWTAVTASTPSVACALNSVAGQALDVTLTRANLSGQSANVDSNFNVNWGDGSSNVYNAGPNPGATVSASHTWNTAGTYTLVAQGGVWSSQNGGGPYPISVNGNGPGAPQSCTVTVSAPTSAIAVSCFAGPSPATVGQTVTWSANASGGGQLRSYWSPYGTYQHSPPTGMTLCDGSVDRGASCSLAGAQCYTSGGRGGDQGGTLWRCVQGTDPANYRYTWSGAVTGSTADVSTSYPDAGTKNATVTVSDGISSENSATASCSVVVNSPAAADLTAGSVSVPSATAGSPATLSATASNIGTGASGGFPILFQVQETSALFNSGYLAGLAPGTSGSGSGSYTFPSAGTYQVRACANFNTAWTAIVTESNYDNNCGPWTAVTVSAAQNPALSCSASAGSVSPGQSVTYSANPSGGASGSYTWTAGDGGSFGTGATATRSFGTPGTYAMNVRGSNTSISYCPNVTVAASWCTNRPTDLSITATPARVRAGQSVALTWTAAGVNGENATCTVSGPGVSWSSMVTGVPECSASGSANTTIQTQSTYTLTCAGVSESVTVNVIPNFQEF